MALNSGKVRVEGERVEGQTLGPELSFFSKKYGCVVGRSSPM